MPTVRLTASAALVFAAALFCQPGRGAAQNQVRSYHGAWTVSCDRRSIDTPRCAAVSRKRKTIGTSSGKRRIVINIVRAKGDLSFQVAGPGWQDKLEPVRLELDGEFVTDIPFTCEMRGTLTCAAKTAFTTSLRSRFRKAKTVTIEFVQGNGRPVTMTVPLNGLEEAVAALEGQ